MTSTISLYSSETAVGDFLTCLPVLSGLSKKYKAKINLAIRPKLDAFYGFSDLLRFQPMFESVTVTYPKRVESHYLHYNSHCRRITNNPRHPNRPFGVNRYEYSLRQLGFEFKSDDSYMLELPEYNVEVPDKILVGDRSLHAYDLRRSYHVLRNSGKFNGPEFYFLDYSLPFMVNAYMIQKSPKPFISTFTGIGSLADMLGKETIILWPEEHRLWAGQTFKYTYKQHYFQDRKSKLVYLDDFDIRDYEWY